MLHHTVYQTQTRPWYMQLPIEWDCPVTSCHQSPSLSPKDIMPSLENWKRFTRNNFVERKTNNGTGNLLWHRETRTSIWIWLWVTLFVFCWQLGFVTFGKEKEMKKRNFAIESTPWGNLIHPRLGWLHVFSSFTLLLLPQQWMDSHI